MSLYCHFDQLYASLQNKSVNVFINFNISLLVSWKYTVCKTGLYKNK